MKNKIVIGTANFNKNYGLRKVKLDDYKKNKIVKYCKSKKIQFIDTALNYKLQKINFKNFKVISKIKLPNKNQIYFIKNLETLLIKELKKFNLKYFYCILIHDCKDLTKIYSNYFLQTLNILKKRGLIKKIGISIYEENDIIRAFKIFKPEIIQFPINIFNQNVLSNKMIKFLKRKKILLQARSIFLQGLLLNYNFKNLDSILKKKIKNNLIKMKNYCNKKKISNLDLCTSFIKSQKFIDLITLGIENVSQIDNFIKSLKKKIKIKFNIFNLKNKSLTDPRKWKKKKKL